MNLYLKLIIKWPNLSNHSIQYESVLGVHSMSSFKVLCVDESKVKRVLYFL